jgi:hypothetical protein
VALTAPADVDVELAVNGLARDLDLELLGDVGLVEEAAAIGAGVGQVRLMDLTEYARAVLLFYPAPPAITHYSPTKGFHHSCVLSGLRKWHRREGTRQGFGVKFGR